MRLQASQRQLICPHCHQELHPLDANAQQWGCSNGHRYDTAKQGYLNLHLVQHKRSRQPGDDKAMVQARTRFLEGGFYQPIVEALLEHIPPNINSLVDIGCGEGYYTHAIQTDPRAGDQREVTGIDISKEAIIAACRRTKHIDWLVASGANPPLAQNKTDCVISLFTPLMLNSYDYLLRPKGTLIYIHTGDQHLTSLRQALYDDVKQESANFIEPLTDAGFTLIQQEQVSFDFTLSEPQQVADLLAMTPHYWRAKPDKKQQFLQSVEQNDFATRADVTMMVLQKNG